jgi:hypothetical protein
VKKPEALRFLLRNALVTPIAVFGDGVGDRVVEALVEGSELGNRDRLHPFESELRDGLADVSVVVHDLPDGEAQAKQLLTVPGRGVTDRRGRRELQAEDLSELIEEEGDSVLELRPRRPGDRPRRDLGAATGDDLGAMFGEELVQHVLLLVRDASRS